MRELPDFEPMTDEEVRAFGFTPTEDGWKPRTRTRFKELEDAFRRAATLERVRRLERKRRDPMWVYEEDPS